MVFVERWQPHRGHALLERLAYPFAYVLNRPSLAGLARLLYNFALRCNGIGISYDGRSGVTSSEERFLRRIADDLRDGLVLDVGANVGSYSAFVRSLAPLARIVAFEPHPKTILGLQPVAARHGFEALNLAVGETAGEATLHDFADADGSTQASLDAAAVSLHGGGPTVAHRVECVTLDDYAARRGWDRIALLKVDTEGFDLSVLKGAQRLLAERRIGLVQFEFIPSNIALHVTMRQFFDILGGYNIGRLCLNGDIIWFNKYTVKDCEIFLPQILIARPC